MLRRNFISAASALLGAAFVKTAPVDAAGPVPDTSKLQLMLTHQVSQTMEYKPWKSANLSFEAEQQQMAEEQRLSQLWTEGYVLVTCPWLAKYQVGFQVQHRRHEMAYCVAHFKLGADDLFRAMFFHGEVLKPVGVFYHQQRDAFVMFPEVKQLADNQQQALSADKAIVQMNQAWSIYLANHYPWLSRFVMPLEQVRYQFHPYEPGVHFRARFMLGNRAITRGVYFEHGEVRGPYAFYDETNQVYLAVNKVMQLAVSEHVNSLLSLPEVQKNNELYWVPFVCGKEYHQMLQLALAEVGEDARA